MNDLRWIQEYYASLCDGEWEQSYGINIETLDNPGWCATFDLFETALEEHTFETVAIQRSDADWIHCSVKDHQFVGAGGPKNLEEILSMFRRWVENFVAQTYALDMDEAG